MKKLFTLLLFTLFFAKSFSQTPQKMSYQAVIRNSSDALVTNHAVGMKISILKDATPVFIETQTSTTNANGLVTVEIGSGTMVTGTFAGIDWSSGTYFIKTETDPTGGTNYTITGTSQLLSVPYALYSGKTENIDAIMQKLKDIEQVVTTQIPPSSSGLVAYYPFNGNANDESGNGLNGVVNNAVLTSDRFGNANSAYSFSDNQEITIPSSGNQNLYPITISLWYNVASLTDDWHGSGNLFGKYSSASWNGYEIQVGVYNNVPNLGGFENDGNGAAPWYLTSPNNRVIGYYNEAPFLQRNLSLNPWYHYVFVVDETGGKIYVDGKLISSHAWTGTPGACTNTDIWKIGGYYSHWFNGKIDDIKIYNRALSETEIRQILNDNGQINQTSKVQDIDGNSYNTIKIGNQTWMAENLRTTKYADGTPIQLVNSNAGWDALSSTSKAYCWYNDDISNKVIYGALYTWTAAMNGVSSSSTNPSNIQGVCPTGWHVPSVREWDQLTNFLIANGYNYDETPTGNKIAKSMAATSGWQLTSVVGSAGSTDHPEKRNSSGFTAYPGGLRYPNGTSQLMSLFSFWWSSTEANNLQSWRMEIYYSNTSAGTLYANEVKEDGLGVRCLKD